MNPVTAALAAVLVVALLAFVAARFWGPLLKDLAGTRDEELRYLTRRGWAVAIVAMFPLGALMYMRYGKGPDHYL